ncbi:MAG: hypothetical protein ACREUD_08800 [Gammaproteobacteria bacterium]
MRRKPRLSAKGTLQSKIAFAVSPGLLIVNFNERVCVSLLKIS